MKAEAFPAGRSPEPRPGDILLFIRPHRWIDYFIKLLTLSKYYHAGIYAGDNKVIEARPRGVASNSLQDREGGFVVIPAPEGRGQEALAWAITQIGDGFDRLDMLVILLEHVFTHLHLNYSFKGKYSCTEFVATAYAQAGVCLVPGQDLNDVEPKDLARLLPKDS